MANYKEIQGFPIQNLSSDPVPYAQELINNPYAGNWSSGGNLNTARQHPQGSGNTTAGLSISGSTGTLSAVVEQYDGSSWTEVGDVNTARQEAASSLNAPYSNTLFFSGSVSPKAQTESWNGSAWTEVADLNTGRDQGAGAGSSSTAALMISGSVSPYIQVESWNGSAWTEVGDVNAGRRENPASAGTSTSALFTGGYAPPGSPGFSAANESWNGTSWTEVADLNTGRRTFTGAGASNTSALVFGGNAPPYSATTESWDGSSWTEVNDLAQARSALAGSGTATNALASGGYNPSYQNSTEEWTFSGLPPSTPAAGYSDAIIGQMYYNSTTGQFKAIKTGVGSWSSGGTLNGGRYGIMGAGTLTAGLAMGGTFQPTDTTKNTAETYDGTSWTNAPTLPGNIRDGGSWGVQTSAVQVGGSTSPGATPFGSTAYEFDGSSFSNGGSLNTARRYNAGAGAASTAGITFGGGNPGPYVAITESYDGSTFTEVADLNTARNYLGAAGTQTAAIAAGGNTGSNVANVELWDGSSWTETTDINTARGFASPSAGMGSQTAAIVVSGDPNNVESWDGTSWTEIADLGTSRSSGHTVGYNSTSAGMYFGGSPNSYATYTEEWDKPDFNITTLTTS